MKYFIEADSIARERISGIGYATIEIIKALSFMLFDTDDQLVIIIPYGTKKYIKNYNFKNIKVRLLPPGYKYVNFLLVRTGIPISVDLFYGKGFYIFPNYKNWFVPFSRSATFVHDLSFKLYPDTVEPKNRRYLNKNIYRWLSRTDVILAISESTKNDIIGHYPSLISKVKKAYLGIDEKQYVHQDSRIANKVLKKYDLPINYILFIGNIEPRKNLDVLIDSYNELYKKNQNILPLVIIGGDGWLNGSLTAKIENLQKLGLKIIRPVKYVTDIDLPVVYSIASLLVHPALYEGFGLSLLQAMACGVPVIASNSSSMPEVGGKAAVYFNSGSSHELAESIESVLTDKKLRSRMIKHGYLQVKKYPWKNTALALVNASKELYNKT